MEKSATLQYINLAFIPCDSNVVPNKNHPLVPQTKNPPSLAPKNPRTATESELG